MNTLANLIERYYDKRSYRTREVGAADITAKGWDINWRRLAAIRNGRLAPEVAELPLIVKALSIPVTEMTAAILGEDSLSTHQALATQLQSENENLRHQLDLARADAPPIGGQGLLTQIVRTHGWAVSIRPRFAGPDMHLFIGYRAALSPVPTERIPPDKTARELLMQEVGHLLDHRAVFAMPGMNGTPVGDPLAEGSKSLVYLDIPVWTANRAPLPEARTLPILGRASATDETRSVTQTILVTALSNNLPGKWLAATLARDLGWGLRHTDRTHRRNQITHGDPLGHSEAARAFAGEELVSVLANPPALTVVHHSGPPAGSSSYTPGLLAEWIKQHGTTQLPFLVVLSASDRYIEREAIRPRHSDLTAGQWSVEDWRQWNDELVRISRPLVGQRQAIILDIEYPFPQVDGQEPIATDDSIEGIKQRSRAKLYDNMDTYRHLRNLIYSQGLGSFATGMSALDPQLARVLEWRLPTP